MIHLEIPVYTLIRNTIIVFALCLFGIGIPYIAVAESSSIVAVASTAGNNCEDVISIPIEVVPEVIKAAPVPIARAAPAKPRPTPRKKLVEEKVAKPSSTSIAKTVNLTPTTNYTDYQGVIWFLKSHERFSPIAFNDFKQYTIGWGVKATSKNQQMTIQQADALFTADINKRHAFILKRYPNLNNDRCVSLVLTNLMFNLGYDGFGKGLHAAILKYDKDNISSKRDLCFQIKKYHRAGGKPLSGLVKRRNAEVELIMASDQKRQKLYRRYKDIVIKELQKNSNNQ